MSPWDQAFYALFTLGTVFVLIVFGGPAFVHLLAARRRLREAWARR